MKGFYKKKEITTPKRKKTNFRKISGCESCKQYHKCENGKFGVSGSGSNGILIIDDMVSIQEERGQGDFSGIDAKYLKSCLGELGVKLEECYYMHSMRCYAGGKKENISTAMRNGCKTLFWKDIKSLNPDKIILLGEEPIKMLYGDRISKSRINSGADKFYSLAIPDQEIKTWVFPNYSPRYVMEALSEKINFLKRIKKYKKEDGPFWERSLLVNDTNFKLRHLYFNQYLKKAIQHKKRFPIYDFKAHTVSIETVEEATAMIKALNKPGRLATDFESDRISCYHPDSELLTISLATADVSYGFSYYGNNPEFLKALRDLFSNPDITFIVHNMEMELSWTRTIIGVDMPNIIDTLLLSHFLRPAISGGDNLKFNALEVCGVLGYDEAVERYISAPTKYIYKRGKKKKAKFSIYDQNRMKEMPLRERNLYCASDSYFTYKVFEYKYPLIQRNKKQFNLFKLYLEGEHVFTESGEVGFVVDEVQMIKNLQVCDEKLTILSKQIEDSPELDIWYENDNRDFNPDSGDHLRKLLFDLMGFDTPRRTDRGLKSTDAEVLSTIAKDSPIVGLIEEYNKYSAIEQTIEGIQRATVEGVLHAKVGLAKASTGRSNSSDPNMQNNPKDGGIAEQMVNEILTVPKGYQIYAPDYSQLESRGGFSVHGDMGVKAEILDPHMDTHSAMAKAIFIDIEKATKRIYEIKYPDKKNPTQEELDEFFHDDLRAFGKTINFLSLFGGGIGKMFQSLWLEGFKDYHRQYFAEIGMDSPEKFKSHCKYIYDSYWSRYVKLKEWRDTFWANFVETGRAESPEGWVIDTPISKNMCTNFPIQGGSFACCLRGLVQLHKEMKKRNMKSKIILMIHDSVEIMTTFEEYFDGGLKELVEQCMVTFVNENTDWLKINLEMDGGFFLGNWANKVKEKDWEEKYGKTKVS